MKPLPRHGKSGLRRCKLASEDPDVVFRGIGPADKLPLHPKLPAADPLASEVAAATAGEVDVKRPKATTPLYSRALAQFLTYRYG